MKGIIRYFEEDPEFINSVEGWVVKTEDSSYFLVEESQREVKRKASQGLIKDGDEVQFELITDCYVEGNKAIHSLKAKVILHTEQKQKLFLIDIDGTICDDIKNEDSHLYPTANVFPKALDIINKWYQEGNVITFFTAFKVTIKTIVFFGIFWHFFCIHYIF